MSGLLLAGCCCGEEITYTCGLCTDEIPKSVFCTLSGLSLSGDCGWSAFNDQKLEFVENSVSLNQTHELTFSSKNNNICSYRVRYYPTLKMSGLGTWRAGPDLSLVSRGAHVGEDCSQSPSESEAFYWLDISLQLGGVFNSVSVSARQLENNTSSINIYNFAEFSSSQLCNGLNFSPSQPAPYGFDNSNAAATISWT